MKALKALVVVMGVLILVGLGVVIVTVTRQAGKPSEKTGGAPPGVSPPVAGAGLPGFGEVALPIPADYAPAEMVADGDRLIVRLESADGVARILVLDLRTGRTLGTFALEPKEDLSAPR